jgi:hypothetical protein
MIISKYNLFFNSNPFHIIILFVFLINIRGMEKEKSDTQNPIIQKKLILKGLNNNIKPIYEKEKKNRLVYSLFGAACSAVAYCAKEKFEEDKTVKTAALGLLLFLAGYKIAHQLRTTIYKDDANYTKKLEQNTKLFTIELKQEDLEIHKEEKGIKGFFWKVLGLSSAAKILEEVQRFQIDQNNKTAQEVITKEKSEITIDNFPGAPIYFNSEHGPFHGTNKYLQAVIRNGLGINLWLKATKKVDIAPWFLNEKFYEFFEASWDTLINKYKKSIIIKLGDIKNNKDKKIITKNIKVFITLLKNDEKTLGSAAVQKKENQESLEKIAEMLMYFHRTTPEIIQDLNADAQNSKRLFTIASQANEIREKNEKIISQANEIEKQKQELANLKEVIKNSQPPYYSLRRRMCSVPLNYIRINNKK